MLPPKKTSHTHRKNPFIKSPSADNTSSGGVIVEREVWSNNAFSLDREYKTVKDVVLGLRVADAKNTRPIVTSCTQ